MNGLTLLLLGLTIGLVAALSIMRPGVVIHTGHDSPPSPGPGCAGIIFWVVFAVVLAIIVLGQPAGVVISSP